MFTVLCCIQCIVDTFYTAMEMENMGTDDGNAGQPGPALTVHLGEELATTEDIFYLRTHAERSPGLVGF